MHSAVTEATIEVKSLRRWGRWVSRGQVGGPNPVTKERVKYDEESQGSGGRQADRSKLRSADRVRADKSIQMNRGGREYDEGHVRKTISTLGGYGGARRIQNRM